MTHEPDRLNSPDIASINLSNIGKSEISEQLLSGFSPEKESRHYRLDSGISIVLKKHVRHDLFLLSGQLKLPTVSPFLSGDFISFNSNHDTVLMAEKASFLKFSDTHLSTEHFHCIRTAERESYPSQVEGLTVSMLRDEKNGHTVSLVEWEKGSAVRNHDHKNGEEILVLSGELQDQYGSYKEGTWLRFYPGIMHAPHAKKETKILLRNSFL